MTDADKFDPAEYVRRSRPRRMVDLFGLTLATDSTDPAECQLEARLFTLHTAEGEGHNRAVPGAVYDATMSVLKKSPNVSNAVIDKVHRAMSGQLEDVQEIVIVARAPVFQHMPPLLTGPLLAKVAAAFEVSPDYVLVEPADGDPDLMVQDVDDILRAAHCDDGDRVEYRFQTRRVIRPDRRIFVIAKHEEEPVTGVPLAWPGRRGLTEDGDDPNGDGKRRRVDVSHVSQ